MARCPTCHRRLVSGRACATHGGAPAEAPRLAIAPPAWREPVGELLGAGGFAAVWALAGDRVLKVAHAAHDLARARLAREAEALAAIGAPAVPRLHATGVLDDGRAWLVMDRIAGTTLGDVTAAGPLRPPEVVALGVATLEALARVHAARFVHRDLKPDNLVRTPDGAVVILDLGLARKLPADPDDPTRASVQVGSLEYMPPEQLADSADVDERSDLYAFGCVLYELATGRPPFVGDVAALERAHATLRPPRMSALASVPAAVEAVAHDCLAKDRARRPASAVAAAARLARATPDSGGGRHTHSMSMIREGKQPVVLLWAELPRVDRALLGLLTGRRLAVASQRGRRVLAGVVGGEHSDPAAVALAAARDLAAAGARVALHLEALRVGGSASAPTLEGDAVARPEGWLPEGPWTGIVITRALAAVIQAATRASDAGPAFRALADEQSAGELFGREAMLSDLIADAAATLHGLPKPKEHSGSSGSNRARRDSSSGSWTATGPAFALLVGEPGVGKSAFAAELVRRLGQLGVRVHHGTVPAPGTGKPPYAALAPLVPLAAPAPGSIVRAVGDALRSAARGEPLAVVLDDLHHADHDLLDALEYATLGGETLPLWILGVAAPRIDTKRPQLGARAERRRRDVLPPLDEDAGVMLAASLLHPAEYPPLRALRRLHVLARGNPLHLATLARAIHERGAIRERPGGAHYLDTTALDELSPAALGPWLAARELAELGVELVALARLCAVLGGEVEHDELVAIVDAVERSGGATTTIDVDVGLRALVSAGILITSEHGHQFRQPLVEEGVYATTLEEERLALHRAALEHWRGGDLATPAIAERVAHHAEASGEPAIAARAFAALGAHAYAEHRLLDADQAWSGALRHLPARDEARARALLGRAQARYRLQRMNEAIVDLAEAAAIAAEIGDLALEIEALIEQGIVQDFMENISGGAAPPDAIARSKALAAHARARLGDAAARYPGLAIDLDLADARTLFREQRFDEGAPMLRAVLDAARAHGRHETATIAALLLGCELSELKQLDDAERVFDEMIAECRARDDRFHLAAAYGNRAWLWSARGAVDRTAEDLRLVIQLARESGQAHFERVATYNLAEDRLWDGALDEALQLARRSFALQTRAGEGSTRPDRMLVARVLAALGDHRELAEVLATFDGETLAEDEAAFAAALAAHAHHDAARWQVALPRLDVLPPSPRLELLHLAARDGALPGDVRAAAVELAAADPFWRRRVGEFGAAPDHDARR